MKLSILFRSYKREQMALENLQRCVLARAYALKHVEGIKAIELTHWIDTEKEAKLYSTNFGDQKWMKRVVITGYNDGAAQMIGEFMRTMDADMFEWLWEDVGVYEDTYALAISMMMKRYPRRDKHHPRIVSNNGVIGCRVANYPKHFPWQSSYGIPHFIGSGIMECHYKAYPNLPIFCPDYKRVIWEVEFAAFLRFHNLIWYAPEVRIDHEWKPDNIHKKATEKGGAVKRDKAMLQERGKRGYHWGINFDLVGDLDEALAKRNPNPDSTKMGIYGSREDFA